MNLESQGRSGSGFAPSHAAIALAFILRSKSAREDGIVGSRPFYQRGEHRGRVTWISHPERGFVGYGKLKCADLAFAEAEMQSRGYSTLAPQRLDPCWWHADLTLLHVVAILSDGTETAMIRNRTQQIAAHFGKSNDLCLGVRERNSP